MLLYQFNSPDIHPNTLINTVFVHNNHSYKIKNLIKSWGKPPVLLGYIEVIDEKGNTHIFLIKCIANFRQNNDWIIKIETLPDTLKKSSIHP